MSIQNPVLVLPYPNSVQVLGMEQPRDYPEKLTGERKMRATSIYFARRHRQKALKMTQIHNLRRCYIQHRCSITVPYYPCHAMMLFTPANIRLNLFIALFSKCFRINLFPDLSLWKGKNTRSSTILLVLKKCFATAFFNILFSYVPLVAPKAPYRLLF